MARSHGHRVGGPGLSPIWTNSTEVYLKHREDRTQKSHTYAPYDGPKQKGKLRKVPIIEDAEKELVADADDFRYSVPCATS